MIDENLCRAELSPSDRARYTARRKAIYEDLHPETKHGGDRKSDQVENFATRSFAADTAAKTGQTDRAIRMHAERGEKVLPEVLDLIRGTVLDTGTYLDRIKRLPGNEQYKAAKRDLANERGRRVAKRTIVRVADAPLDHEEAVERQVAALMALWNKTGPEARNEFLARIDTPVFNRSAA